MRTARRESYGQALDRRLVNRLLTGSIRAQRLGQKHRQRLGRREQPFAMRQQHRLDFVEQFRPRQQIEKAIGIAVTDLGANLSLLRAGVTNSIMHSGWLLE